MEKIIIPELPKNNNQHNFSKLENIYDDDPQQIKNFFDIRNVFKVSYKHIPTYQKVLLYPMCFIFIIFGLITFITNIPGINEHYMLLMMFIGIILVFIGLKLLQGFAVFSLNNALKSIDIYSLLNNNTSEKFNLDFHIISPDKLKNTIKSMFFEIPESSYSVQNVLHYSKNENTLLSADLIFDVNEKNSAIRRKKKSIIYFSFNFETENQSISDPAKINNWFIDSLNFNVSSLFDLDDIELLVKNKAAMLVFPFKFFSDEISFNFVKAFYEVLFETQKVPIENNPLLLLNPELTIENASVHGLSIGDLIDENVSEEIAESICTSNENKNLSFEENLEILKNKFSIIYLKNDISIYTNKGVVESINFGQNFWEDSFDLNNGNFRTYFGEPDFEYDNFTGDSYTPIEDYYCYKNKGLEVTELDKTKEIIKITFKKLKLPSK